MEFSRLYVLSGLMIGVLAICSGFSLYFTLKWRLNSKIKTMMDILKNELEQSFSGCEEDNIVDDQRKVKNFCHNVDSRRFTIDDFMTFYPHTNVSFREVSGQNVNLSISVELDSRIRYLENIILNDGGKKGEKGNTGLTGDPGPKGDDGKEGMSGLSGNHGIKGTKGSKGDVGVDGAKGDKGLKGAQGPPGTKGDIGDNGFTGLPGQNGEPGIPGHAGFDGRPGLNGEKGNKGYHGRPGRRGKNVKNIS